MEVIQERFLGRDLVDIIALVRDMDVFMGFHGAGFVNSLYLQPVRGLRQGPCSCHHWSLLHQLW